MMAALPLNDETAGQALQLIYFELERPQMAQPHRWRGEPNGPLPTMIVESASPAWRRL